MVRFISLRHRWLNMVRFISLRHRWLNMVRFISLRHRWLNMVRFISLRHKWLNMVRFISLRHRWQVTVGYHSCFSPLAFWLESDFEIFSYSSFDWVSDKGDFRNGSNALIIHPQLMQICGTIDEKKMEIVLDTRIHK